MNYALQNIVAFFLIVATIVAAAYFLVLRQDGQYIPESLGDIGCIHPVYISEDNLQPTLTRGTYISLNQCVRSTTSMTDGTVIYFEYDDENVLGIIEGRETKVNKTYYTVNIGDKTVEVDPSTILAYTTLQSEE